MKTKFRGFLTLLLALVVQISFAQQKEVSGTVTSDKGLPLPGVNISVVGTDNGTRTDFDGHFSIQVQPDASLKFTYVGFAPKTVKVGMQSTLTITLKKGEELGPVMISTGYETQLKAESAKAVTTITAEDIEDRPTASALSALQGQVAGLNIGSNSGQPGTSGTIIIRGVGTINGNIEPLFVVDGIPTTKRNFTNINPSAIKSVSVLKGPSATSIYGNRGANGVIVVTTKSGQYNQKLEIKYSSQYGVSELLPLNLELMNSRQKLYFTRNNGLGGMSANMTDAQIEAYARGTNTYWEDIFFRTASMNKQNLSITSGSKNTASSTGISYLDQEGTFIASGLQRFGFRNKFTGKTNNDKFHYSTNIAMSYSKSNWNDGAGQRSILFNPFLNAMQGSPLLSPYDPDGSITSDGGFELGDATVLVKSNSPIILLNSIRHNTQLREQFNLRGGFQADWNFAKHFTAGVDVSMNLTEYKETNILSPKSLLGPFQVDQRAEFGGIDREHYTRDFRFYARTNLRYQNSFGAENKHSLTVNLYTEYNKNHYYYMGYGIRGLNSKFIGTDNAFNLKVKEALGGTGTPDYIYLPKSSFNLNNIETGLFSYFATANYDYNRRYGLSASIRRDASPRFTQDNQWGTFWSVAGRWNIDEEAWMENSAFNLLKLRAGYGTSGNQRIAGGFYEGLGLFKNKYSIGVGYNDANAYYPSVIANPTLRWETTKTLNIGVDFGVWKNKLSGSLDVYQKKTTDLFQNRPISVVNATSIIKTNIGSMQNEGVELQMTYNILSDKDWKIAVSANGAYNHNEILKLPGGKMVKDGQRTLAEGQSYGEYYSVRYAGVNPANGQALFYDKDGNLTQKLNEADRVFSDKTIYPELKGGFGLNVSYKGFTLSQSWVFYGNVWRNNLDLADLESSANYTGFNSAASLLHAWQQPGDITDIPRLNATVGTIDHINTSDRYVQDASYLRLRNISLSYTFDKDQLRTLPFTSIQLFLQAENMLTFTKFQGYSPESSYTGTESSRYPSAKTFTLGLNVNF